MVASVTPVPEQQHMARAQAHAEGQDVHVRFDFGAYFDSSSSTTKLANETPDQSHVEDRNRAGEYCCNQQYSVTAITTSTGAISERYAYSAYGQPTILDASGSILSTSSISNRYTYTGREWDATLGLHHFRARWMSPIPGRFLSRDPIGFRGKDLNTYRFLQRQLMRHTDPRGMRTYKPDEGEDSAGGACSTLYTGIDPGLDIWWHNYYYGGGATIDMNQYPIILDQLESSNVTQGLFDQAIDVAIANLPDTTCNSSGNFNKTLKPIRANYGDGGFGFPGTFVYGVCEVLHNSQLPATATLYALGGTVVTPTVSCAYSVACDKSIGSMKNCKGMLQDYETTEKCISISCTISLSFDDSFEQPYDLPNWGYWPLTIESGYPFPIVGTVQAKRQKKSCSESTRWIGGPPPNVF